MADREKVMRGLKHCGSNFWEGHLCEGCPYFPEMKGCMGVLHHDALALLKEQEPRVMTLEELNLGADESVICYSEFCDSRVVNVTAPFCYPGDRLVQLPYIGTEHRNWVDSEQYGVLWRCWTSRPTDEQRKAAAWNG